MGYTGWIGTFEGEKGTGMEKVFESEMVRELRNLGAILFCKTSVPHTLMLGETSNNIIGYTWNPKNRLLSCGGSSGGEGALIGLKGSPVGFGTDVSRVFIYTTSMNSLFLIIAIWIPSGSVFRTLDIHRVIRRISCYYHCIHVHRCVFGIRIVLSSSKLSFPRKVFPANSNEPYDHSTERRAF